MRGRKNRFSRMLAVLVTVFMLTGMMPQAVFGDTVPQTGEPVAEQMEDTEPQQPSEGTQEHSEEEITQQDEDSGQQEEAVEEEAGSETILRSKQLSSEPMLLNGDGEGTRYENVNGTVYLSVSYDGKYINDKNGGYIAYVPVPLEEVASVDLEEYGLGEYLYDEDGDGAYEITALQLVIYAHENIYGGSWDNVIFTGGAGSSYFQGGIFGFDENLNYYLNGEYPLASAGWGATSDQIVLEAGDFLDIASFSSWDFYGDSNYGFHFFADENGTFTHNYAAEAETALPVKLVRSYSGMGTGATVYDAADYAISYGTSYGDAAGTVTTDGSGCADITFPSAGTWYIWADGGYGAEYPEAIVSSPAYATVTVTAAEGGGEEPGTAESGTDGAGTVYISASEDAHYIDDINGAPVAYAAVKLDALEAIDLEDYGLSDYGYDQDGDGKDEITALHLYIYTHEIILGLKWSDVTVTGGAGSIYFAGGLFGYEDENLRYNYNGAYPANESGWGTTADQIVLSDGDFLEVAHFTEWSFYMDSAYGFHYFVDSNDNVALTYTAETGKALSVKLILAGGGLGSGDTTTAEAGYTVYYGKTIGNIEGEVTTDENGIASITFPSAGTWYIWADGGYGSDYPEAIVSAPASATVTVTAAEGGGEEPGTTEPEPEKTLEDIKEEAKAKIDDYKNVEDYREAQQIELTAAKAEAKTKIDAAESEEGVENAVEAGKKAIDEIKTAEQLDQEEIDAVINKITAIGEVTLDSETAITAARLAYDALTAAQQESVTNYGTLTAAEAALQQLKDDAEAAKVNLEKAKVVADLIKEIGDAAQVTLDSEEKITAAREAYEGLTEPQKALVDNLITLTAAETRLSELKADKMAADLVVEKINKIGEDFIKSKDNIEEARKDYDALTDTQKALVTNLDVLTEAESGLKTLEDEITGVVEKIDAIGAVTIHTGNKIKEARDAYTTLTDAQKELVTNYSVLTDAETAIEALYQEAAKADHEKIYQETGAYVAGLGTPNVGSIGGEWMVIDITRAGGDCPEGYYENVVKYVEENIEDNKLHESKGTDNARVILALTSAGYDVTDVNGHNLLMGLTDMEYVRKQGINGPIWALIAFDSYQYEIPTNAAVSASNQVTRDGLVSYILSKQHNDGGWSLMANLDYASDPDITAMAIQALAPYCNTNAEVKAAVDKAVAYLSQIQLHNGGFAWSAEGSCSESCAQVIVALTALGINPETDERFVKNGMSVVDAMCIFAVDGGGFEHVPGGGVNGMATEQGQYALAAYYRFLEEKNTLYDMTDVTIGENPKVEIPADDDPAAGKDDEQQSTGSTAGSSASGTKSGTAASIGTATRAVTKSANIGLEADLTEEAQAVIDEIDTFVTEVAADLPEDAADYSEEQMDSVIDAYKAYMELSDEEKLAVEDSEAYKEFTKVLEKIADFHHYDEASGVDMRENGEDVLPWHIRMVIKPQDMTEKQSKDVYEALGEGSKVFTMNDIYFVNILDDSKWHPGDIVKVKKPMVHIEDYKHAVIVHIMDDGKIELLEGTVDGDTVSFHASSFSLYGIAGTNNDIFATEESGGMVWPWIGGGVLALAILAYIMYRKKKENSEA